MYLSHKKRDQTILKSLYTIKAFPFKIISLETTIIIEDQELIGAFIYVD